MHIGAGDGGWDVGACKNTIICTRRPFGAYCGVFANDGGALLVYRGAAWALDPHGIRFSSVARGGRSVVKPPSIENRRLHDDDDDDDDIRNPESGMQQMQCITITLID